MTNPKDKWNEIYRRDNHNGRPSHVLTGYTDLIPTSGLALDIACGRGINSLYLASHGLTVDAWDISEVAINRLIETARHENLKIRGRIVDITDGEFPTDCYDLILNSHFLDRSLTGSIIRALKPGGLVFFQTFTQDKIASIGPSNPDFLLARDELPAMFAELENLACEDGSAREDPEHSLAGRACFVGRKPG